MNDLQRLFKVRKLTMQQLGDELGIGMHMVQKVVKGTRATPHIQLAIAGYLGLTVEQCFGPDAGKTLLPMVDMEIKKLRDTYEKQLKTKFYTLNIVAGRRKVVNG